jgi:hypothetical protein
MMFDAMTDAVVMNSLMNNHGYYHGSPYQASQPAVTSPQSQNSNMWLVWLFAIVLVVIVLVFLANTFD